MNKYLELSTGHVRQETMNPPCLNHLIAAYGYGAFYYVPDLDDMDDDTPQDLKDVFEFARAQDCHLIQFDSFSDVFEELKTYDW